MKIESDNGLYTEDISAIKLHLEPEQKDGSIKGEVLAERLKTKGLNKKTLDYLLANPNLIPEEWKGKLVYFWGTILRGPDGGRCVLCLCWDDGRWRWFAGWLGFDWNRHNPSAVLASGVPIDNTNCEHKLIHTERLWKEMPKEEGEGIIYTIEKICADCGQYLGTVDVKK